MPAREAMTRPEREKRDALSRANVATLQILSMGVGAQTRQYKVVGEEGLEPSASASRTLRATKLRHSPALITWLPGAAHCSIPVPPRTIARRAGRMGSWRDAERRIPVGGEEKRVGRHPKRPAEDADDKVKERPRIAACKKDREPRQDDTAYRGEAHEDQHDVVRQREDPLDERQPPVQAGGGIRVRQRDMDRLLFVRRWILVAQKRDVRGDADGEPRQFDVPVEPPPRIPADK